MAGEVMLESHVITQEHIVSMRLMHDRLPASEKRTSACQKGRGRRATPSAGMATCCPMSTPGAWRVDLARVWTTTSIHLPVSKSGLAAGGVVVVVTDSHTQTLPLPCRCFCFPLAADGHAASP